MWIRSVIVLLSIFASINVSAFEPIGMNNALPVYLSIDKSLHAAPNHISTSGLNSLEINGLSHTSTGLKAGYRINSFLDIRSGLRLSDSSSSIIPSCDEPTVNCMTTNFSAPQDKIQLSAYIPLIFTNHESDFNNLKYIGIEIGASYIIPGELLGQSNTTDLNFTGHGFFIDISAVRSPSLSDKLIITPSIGLEFNTLTIQGRMNGNQNYYDTFDFVSLNFSLYLISQI